MTLRKIISGGQTGADQGGLAAAAILGLETGGWMPRGFRTDTGPRPDLAERYGLTEHSSVDYPPRTRANVLATDATLIFGNAGSRGCRLTIRLTHDLHKPMLIVSWPPILHRTDLFVDLHRFRQWLINHDVQTLNVAGNRESRAPGIHDACRDFLVSSLTTN
jgi:hypothetical protein